MTEVQSSSPTDGANAPLMLSAMTPPDAAVPPSDARALLPEREAKALDSIFEGSDDVSLSEAGSATPKPPEPALKSQEKDEPEAAPVSAREQRRINGRLAIAIPIRDESGKELYWIGQIDEAPFDGAFKTAEAVFKFVKQELERREGDGADLEAPAPPEPPEAEIANVVTENLIPQWISGRIGKAIADSGAQISAADMEGVESAVWQQALAGRLGDGQISDATGAAIENIVKQLVQSLPKATGPALPPAEEPETPAAAQGKALPRSVAGDLGLERRQRRTGRPGGLSSHPGASDMVERAVDRAYREGLDAGVGMLMDDDGPPRRRRGTVSARKMLITMDLGNAAFGDNLDGEIARILRELAKRIEGNPHLEAGYSQPLLDLNGNEVGYMEIE